MNIKLFFSILKAELKKYVVEIKTYYPDHIGGIINTALIFIGFFFITHSSSHSGEIDGVGSFVGFIIWFFSVGVINETSATISEEKQIGTLEQILIKPTPFWVIMIARSFCWILVGALEVSLLMILFKMIFSIPIGISISTIPVILVTLVGLLGFGLFLAGLTVVYTKTASFSSIIQSVLLFFTGALVPLENFPGLIKEFAQLLPLTRGISYAQNIIKEDMEFLKVIYEKDFYILLLNSVVYFSIGLVFFIFVFSSAKKRGISKNY